jgi:hypothetical protein
VWYVVDELLFGFSANSVYSKALKLVKDDDRVCKIHKLSIYLFTYLVYIYVIYAVDFAFFINMQKVISLIVKFSFLKVEYELGDGLKAYGEETSRGRRRHVR